MKPHRDQVLALVRDRFGEDAAADVMRELDAYGTESYEQERDRVQLAILRLSGGDRAKVREYVRAAKGDFRDVLYWAEYHPLDPAKKRPPGGGLE